MAEESVVRHTKTTRARRGMRPASAPGTSGDSSRSEGANDFEAQLFEACDRLRGSVESSEYKHLVLGLIFLKYISDSFERQRKRLERETESVDSELYTADPDERALVLEDRDEYLAVNAFWVPEGARWETILAAASLPTIGTVIDTALDLIEKENPEQLRGVLPRIYARAALPPGKLGELVNTIARVGFGDDEETARDILGRTYEYFIKTFAKSEGHRGGEFYTPASVTRLLVEMLEPYHGRVFDPACGSCGLFIQSSEFVKSHGGRPQEISIYGQELNLTTWRIGRMNLAIHGLAGRIEGGASSLTDDRNSGVRADFVLANPPFNMKKWGADQVVDDPRWRYGLPPDNNANYAWIQHFIHHLAPRGRAGFVMSNGSLSSTTNREGQIREAIIKADLVDCIVALPPQLFFTTQIPTCLWFLDRDKAAGTRNRHGETLFIDARALGQRLSRTQIEFTDDEIARIASTYHAWREGVGYEDVPGFCRSAALATIEATHYALIPGRYIEVEPSPDEPGEDIDVLTSRLLAALSETGEAASAVREVLGRIAR